MQEPRNQHAQGQDRFAWIDPGVSVWDQWGAVPPPPKLSPTTHKAPQATPAPKAQPQPAPQPPPQPISEDDYAPPPPRNADKDNSESNPNKPPTFHEFDAELDVAELDDRLRPTTTWTARARTVNRSSLTFRSRRMCYPKSTLLMAIHLIDDKPAVLAGRVTTCDYAGEGLYFVEVELMLKPENDDIRQWEAQR